MQSIPNNTKVRFHREHLTPEEFGLSEQALAELEDSVLSIECMATATEEGDKDYEYYDLRTEAGKVLNYAISGYHLTPLSED